ncbi:hypothetical protein M0R45_000105 [Rubus argutus]|uniref:ATPase AAA-type core domain-containing protein n=1 Tax=Rubus argutus TaxID=59490 RepID=A0AAW1VRZ8_RUBAR
MEKALHELKSLVMLPIRNPELATLLGVKPASGVVERPNWFTPWPMKSAFLFIRFLLPRSSLVGRTAPSIVFNDEIDAIALKREDGRIVTQLMTCMDESHRPVLPAAAVDAKSNFQIGHVTVRTWISFSLCCTSGKVHGKSQVVLETDEIRVNTYLG